MCPYQVIVSESSINFFYNGRKITVSDEDPGRLERIKQLIYIDQWDEALRQADIEQVVMSFVQGDITLENGIIYYQGEPVHNVLSERIIGFAKSGFDYKPLINFMEKLYKNPSKRSIDELFKFLEHKSLPISSDGNFLAYKAVRNNWKDRYSGTFDNSIGNEVTIPRRKVDDDANHGCSYGLNNIGLLYSNI